MIIISALLQLIGNQFENSKDSLLSESPQWTVVLCLSANWFYRSGDVYWQGFSSKLHDNSFC